MKTVFFLHTGNDVLVRDGRFFKHRNVLVDKGRHSVGLFLGGRFPGSDQASTVFEVKAIYSTNGACWEALIASPATTLVNAFDALTFSTPKILPSISVNNGMFDEPPVFTTASISPGSRLDLAIVSN